MRKSEVDIGAVYTVKVSNKLVPVKILRVSRFGGWEGENFHTGRSVRVKTAARLRNRLSDNAVAIAEAKRK